MKVLVSSEVPPGTLALERVFMCVYVCLCGGSSRTIRRKKKEERKESCVMMASHSRCSLFPRYSFGKRGRSAAENVLH